LGHALGLGLQEPPFITPYEKTVLEPGMVLAVEPVSWEGDAVGFHVEDNLIVTPHGVENMTRRFGPELIVVG
jgi:Xaa-Pro aminopeptidase